MFPIERGVIYLNHAAVAPWPRRTAEAVQAFAEANLHRGSLDYPRWLQTEQRLRERLGMLLGGMGAEHVALVKNTSEALSFVASGLSWQTGENIVTARQEFPSNRIVWESLADQGVALRQVDLAEAPDPEGALLAAIDRNTRLLTVSSVQYGTGLRLDLERLGAACREREILFCVDAIQSLGALEADVEAWQADFVAADGHKWMLGPEGLGLFYCRPALRDQLHLTQFGWHMVEAVGDFDRRDWEPAHSMRRFECGSPNMLGIHGLEASLSLLQEVGIAEVETRIKAKSRRLAEGLRALGCELCSPQEERRRSGITTFRPPRGESARLQESLVAAGLFCAARGGGIRLSPHFYTPDHLLEEALGRIRSVLQSV